MQSWPRKRGEPGQVGRTQERTFFYRKQGSCEGLLHPESPSEETGCSLAEPLPGGVRIFPPPAGDREVAPIPAGMQGSHLLLASAPTGFPPPSLLAWAPSAGSPSACPPSWDKDFTGLSQGLRHLPPAVQDVRALPSAAQRNGQTVGTGVPGSLARMCMGVLTSSHLTPGLWEQRGGLACPPQRGVSPRSHGPPPPLSLAPAAQVKLFSRLGS